jgi:hypothetical protein
MRSSFALLPAVMALALPASLAHGAERGEAKLTLAGKTIAIDYGRPALAGRDMLARLPAGQSWRMGADSDTTLKSAADLSFGSTLLPKGEYVLSARRSADDKWTLIATNDQRTVEIPLVAQALPASVELYTIELTGRGSQGLLVTKWQTLQLSAPFTAK